MSIFTKRKKLNKEVKFNRIVGKGRVGTVVCYTVLSLWSVMILALFIWTIVASLSTTREIFTNELLHSGLHFENYVAAFTANNMLLYFANSAFYTVASCVLIIVIAAPCSYTLARFSFRFNKVLQNVFVAGIGIPLIMVVLPLFYQASKLNLIGTRPLMIFLYTGINIPFTVYFLMAFFSGIPSVFEEVASIDGCTPIGTFWKIIFPLAQPGIITVTIFNFIAIWNEYFTGLIFASQDQIRPLAVGLQNMINSMRYSGNWSGMFAILVMVFVPTIVLYAVLSEKIIAGVTGGAIKG